MMLVSVVKLVVLVLVVGRSVESSRDISEINLENLCTKGTGEIKTLDDIQNLAGKLYGPGGAGCAEHVRDAIKDMASIASDRTACSMEKSEEIVKFSEKYLRHTKSDQNFAEHNQVPSETTQDIAEINGDVSGTDQVDTKLAQDPSEAFRELPKPLVEFALAFGMKVSATCKQYMIDEFFNTAYDELDFFDRDAVSPYVNEAGVLSRLLDPITKTGEFILPSDLNGVISDIDNEKLYVQSKNGAELARVKERCQKRFMPLYEPILMPIAILARAGFNHRGLQLKWDLMIRPWLKDSGEFWIKVVFLCESLKNFEYVVAPKGSDDNSVKISTEDEVGEATKRAAIEVAKEASNERPIIELKPFEPRAKVGNTVLRWDKFRLKSAVKQFDADKTATERLQDNILKNSFSILRGLSKYANHKPLFESLIGKMACRGGRCKNDDERKTVNSHLVRLVETDDYSTFVKLLKSMVKASAKKKAKRSKQRRKR